LGRTEITKYEDADGPNEPQTNSLRNSEPQTDSLRNSKDFKRLLPGLLISAVCLAVIFYFVDFQKLLDALRLANYRLVILATLVGLAWLAVRGLVWQALLRDQATFKQSFFTICEGYLLNNVLPFRLGEVGRGFLMGHKASLPFWEVFSTIVIERALDMAMAAGLLLCTLPFALGADWAVEAAIVAGGLIVLFLVFLYLLARHRQRALGVFHKASVRWPALQRRGGNALEAFLTGLTVLTDLRIFLRATSLVILDWLLALLQFFILMRAFFPQASPLWAAFVLGISALGLAAPSSPGAIGVYEISVIGGLAIFGQDASTAFAFALVAHAISYLWTSIFGIYALVQDGQSLIGLYRQLRTNDATREGG
jgi:uncharacterized protein (TIRG00374 family)